MIFLFPRWDMLVLWEGIHNSQSQGIIRNGHYTPLACRHAKASTELGSTPRVIFLLRIADKIHLCRWVQRIEKKQAAATWRIFGQENFMNLKNPWKLNWTAVSQIAKKRCFFFHWIWVKLTPSPWVTPIPYQALPRPYPRLTWSLCAQLGSKVPREGIISNSLLGGAFHRLLASSTRVGFFHVSTWEGCIKHHESDNYLQTRKEIYQDFQNKEVSRKKKLSWDHSVEQAHVTTEQHEREDIQQPTYPWLAKSTPFGDDLPCLITFHGEGVVAGNLHINRAVNVPTTTNYQASSPTNPPHNLGGVGESQHPAPNKCELVNGEDKPWLPWWSHVHGTAQISCCIPCCPLLG